MKATEQDNNDLDFKNSSNYNVLSPNNLLGAQSMTNLSSVGSLATTNHSMLD